MDFQRYSGLWYQIAKPRDFKWDKGCVFATAEYFWNPTTQKLNVKNTCLDQNRKPIYSRSAEAWSNGNPRKLRILFNDGLPADPEGQYWVLDTDYDNYSIVSDGKDMVWILSRSPKVSKSDFLKLTNNVKSMGYNLDTILSNGSLIY